MKTLSIEDAIEIIKKLEKNKEKLNRDPKAFGNYWNADDWGSVSGWNDATEWVNREQAKKLLKLLKK